MSEATQRVVLVVDDDPRARELMQIVLRHAGYRVLTAADADAARAVLAEERPDLGLFDFLMPGMTGLDLARWIRQQAALHGMRVVLLTGMDSGEFAGDLSDAGVDDVVTKPFERAALLQRLAALLND